jgi:hypothetical protein
MSVPARLSANALRFGKSALDKKAAPLLAFKTTVDTVDKIQ